MIQIDGSDHRWFEERGAACSLLVFIDDATGKLMQLRFVSRESTSFCFDCLRDSIDAQVMLGASPCRFYEQQHQRDLVKATRPGTISLCSVGQNAIQSG